MENKNLNDQQQPVKNEGWAEDISSHGLRHYYKDGVSLCGRAKEKHFFRNFDKESLGYAFAEDCKLCIKKKKELVEKENSKQNLAK